MKNTIIITDRVSFKEALQKDSLLFQSVCDIVEALDGRHPLAHHITRKACVISSPVREPSVQQNLDHAD